LPILIIDVFVWDKPMIYLTKKKNSIALLNMEAEINTAFEFKSSF